VSDLRELYQEVILDHNRRPRNFRRLEDANRVSEGRNPLCGDHLTLYVRVQGDVIEEVTFQGSGCAISKASASLLTEAVKGKTLAEADTLFGAVHRLVTGHPVDGPAEDVGKLEVLSGVSGFPVRVKCATLAWHALQAALKNEDRPVTTEETP
jgi:nitrogen fixation NifU-like protein